MFPFRESTQRRICRVAFVLMCLLPTASLLACALWMMTPLYRAAEAARWSRETGTSVSMERLLHPTPGVTRLHDVELKHPDSGKMLATIRELETSRADGRIVLLAAQPRLEGESIDELWGQLRRRLLDESFPPASEIHLVASDVTIHSATDAAQTLSQVDAAFHADGQQRAVEAKYRVAGIGMAAPAVVRIAHQSGRFAGCRWSTGGAALPVAPWAEQLPWLKRLGDACRFRGEIYVERSADGLRGEIHGELSDVDLDRLVSDALPHKLSGRAKLTIDAARFEGEQLIEIEGHLFAGPGVIGRSLIDAAAAEWSLQAASPKVESDPKQTLLRYDRLAVDFTLHGQSLSLRGSCSDAPEGTLLMLSDGRRWTTPLASPYSPASLIRVLSPDRESHVPANETTRQLIRWLPLADAQAPQESTKPPQVHLRAGETSP